MSLIGNLFNVHRFIFNVEDNYNWKLLVIHKIIINLTKTIYLIM